MIFDFFISSAFWVLLLISGIPLLAGSLAGLVVAVLQSATQIQEQSVVYLVKITAVIITFFLCGGWFWDESLLLFQDVLLGMGALGRM